MKQICCNAKNSSLKQFTITANLSTSKYFYDFDIDMIRNECRFKPKIYYHNAEFDGGKIQPVINL